MLVTPERLHVAEDVLLNMPLADNLWHFLKKSFSLRAFFRAFSRDVYNQLVSYLSYDYQITNIIIIIITLSDYVTLII